MIMFPSAPFFLLIFLLRLVVLYTSLVLLQYYCLLRLFVFVNFQFFLPPSLFHLQLFLILFFHDKKAVFFLSFLAQFVQLVYLVLLIAFLFLTDQHTQLGSASF